MSFAELVEMVMNLDSLVSFGLWVGLALLALVFQVRRMVWRRNAKRRPGRIGWYPGGAALGNALQALQVITQPRVQHVIQQMVDEDVDEDAEGGPADPVAHLHRQARKIRQGRLVGPITALSGARASRGRGTADSL